jgi:hypothetical protein
MRRGCQVEGKGRNRLVPVLVSRFSRAEQRANVGREGSWTQAGRERVRAAVAARQRRARSPSPCSASGRSRKHIAPSGALWPHSFCDNKRRSAKPLRAVLFLLQYARRLTRFTNHDLCADPSRRYLLLLRLRGCPPGSTSRSSEELAACQNHCTTTCVCMMFL